MVNRAGRYFVRCIGCLEISAIDAPNALELSLEQYDRRKRYADAVLKHDVAALAAMREEQ